MIKEYRSKIEAELTEICGGILKLLDQKLVPAAGAADSKVFYLKMKGDYHRYLTEFNLFALRLFIYFLLWKTHFIFAKSAHEGVETSIFN